AQGLTGIVVQQGAAQRALEAEADAADQHIELAQQMARESLAEARRSVWNLRAPALERGDLSDALRGLASRPIRPETTASFEQRGEPWPLPPGIESALLRVGQEALVNVAKHAGATQVRLALEYTPDAVRLSISDDGVGFDELPAGVAAPGPWGGFGLLGMRERLMALGGTLELTSDRGAHVVAVVPRESIQEPEARSQNALTHSDS
ncbi:MAG: sensor histidine kinase, partial [Roseiflexaceae bacterium]